MKPPKEVRAVALPRKGGGESKWERGLGGGERRDRVVYFAYMYGGGTCPGVRL